MHHLSGRKISGVVDHPNKRYLQAYYEAGAMFERGESKKALTMIIDALRMEPKDADGLMLLAIILNVVSMHDDARGVFEKALADFPDLAWVNHCFSMFLHEQGEKHRARTLMGRAITLDPNEPVHYVNYAVMVQNDGFLLEAETELRKAAEKFPGDGRVDNALSVNLVEQRRYDEAIEYGRRAAESQPKDALCRGNLAIAYLNLGRFTEAEAWADRAIKLVTDLEATRAADSWLFVRGQARLAQGRLKSGWADYVRRRVEISYMRKHVWDPRLPVTKDTDVRGKRVAVFGEQGLGDEILFNGVLSDIAREAEAVIYVCNNRLTRLIARAFPEIETALYYTRESPQRTMLAMSDEDLERFRPDAAMFVGEFFPKYLTTITDFEKRSARAAADPERVAHWRTKLADLSDRPKVGVCWRSGMNQGARAKFYAPLKRWCETLRAYDIDVINLQYDDCTAELVAARNRYDLDIVNYGGTELDLKMDLDENAALCSALDLVVSAQTAAGVLSGAVGTPTWFLMPVQPWNAFGVEGRLPFFGDNVKGITSEGYADWDEVFTKLRAGLDDRFEPRRSS